MVTTMANDIQSLLGEKAESLLGFRIRPKSPKNVCIYRDPIL
jgi:hypothetical protein